MRWNKRLAAITSGLVGGMVLAVPPTWAGWGDVNLPYGVTPVSQMNYDLNMLILWVCIIIGILVFGAMGYSMYYHRKSVGHEAVQFHHSTALEITWTAIPIAILVFCAIVSTKGLVLLYDTSNSELDIKVTGYQWLWRYDYQDSGITVYSKLDPASNQARQLGSSTDPEDVDNYLLNVDNPVVIPVDTKVRFLITGGDVIHAWWVPDFGWKWDAIPGYVNEGWVVVEKPGVYRGQCTELCGRDHGFMPIVVIAKTKEEYQQWVTETKKSQGLTGGGEKAAVEQSASDAKTRAQASQRGRTGAATPGEVVAAR